MDTFWGFGWCLFPLLLFGAIALACVLMGARRGCGCGGMRCTGREPPQAPRGPAA